MFALSRTSLLVTAALASVALADSYPVVLTAMSPTLQYLPDIIRWNATRWGDAPGVWNQTYTDVQGMLDGTGTPANYSRGYGILGIGDQVVWAAGGSGDDAPCLNYSFTGTGIRFKGYWNAPSLPGSADSSVELVIDGNSTTITGQQGDVRELVTLAENTALENGEHNVQLFVRSGNVSILFVEPTLYFANVSLATIVQGEAAAKQDGTMRSEEPGDTDTSPSVIFPVKMINSTSYIINPQLQVNPSAWVPVRNHLKSWYSHIASNWENHPFRVDLGSGNIFVRINGTLAPRNDEYKVEVLPAPPGREGVFKGIAFSAPWSGNSTLYLAALDPTQSYTLSFENMPRGPNERWATVHSIEMWKGNATGDTVTAGTGNGTDSGSAKDGNSGAGSGGRSKSNTGAIAGGVVGGVVGLALIGILGFFLGRKASKKNSDHAGAKETNFEIEDHTATAYQPDTTSIAPTVFPPKVTQSPLESPHAQTPIQPYTKPGSALGPSDTSRTSSDMTPSSQPLTKSMRTTITSTGDLPFGTAASSTSTSLQLQAHRQSARPTSIVDVEEDAGALVPHSFEERTPRHVIPPQYNPAWAPRLRTDIDTEGSLYPESAVSPSTPLSRGQEHTW